MIDQSSCPKNCLDCAGAARSKDIFSKFAHVDYGHALCMKCGITFDNNVNDVIDIKLDPKEIADLTDENEYRKYFVETSKIASEGNDVYDDFDWEDTGALKQGVVRHVVNVIEKHKSVTDNTAILDLGCGNGFTAIELVNSMPSATVTAVDPSPEVLKANGAERVYALQGTLDGLKFPDEKFDVVVIIGNLMLHTNPQTTLSEAKRILKSGGLLIVDFKNVNSTVRRISKVATRLGLQNFLPRRLLERAFVNMRFGYTVQYVRKIGDHLGLRELQTYSKPPRLLEFSNKAELQSGVTGYIWRATDLLDGFLDQRAWVQIVFQRK